MNDRKRLDYLAGQMATTRVLLRVLLEAYPNPQQLVKALEHKFQLALAATIPTRVSEAYLSGMADEAGSLWDHSTKEP